MIPAASSPLGRQERQRRRRHDADDVDGRRRGSSRRPRSRRRTCRPSGACPGRRRSSRPAPTSRCAVARPSANAVVGFRSTLATPRMPSVPNRRGTAGRLPRVPADGGQGVGDGPATAPATAPGWRRSPRSGWGSRRRASGPVGEVRRDRHGVRARRRGRSRRRSATSAAPDSRSRSAIEPPIVTRTRSGRQRVDAVRRARRRGPGPPRTSASPVIGPERDGDLDGPGAEGLDAVGQGERRRSG